MAHEGPFRGEHYDRIRSGCRRSAQAVVPLVLERIPGIRSVVDVGCGEGWWASAFADHGIAALGVDAGEPREVAPGVTFVQTDLVNPVEVTLGYDLAISLEVAEHLPRSSAEPFVALLCRLSDHVLFSAAVPRQGGTGHVNCQPPSYWADLFAAHGYACDGSIRWDVWENPAVEPWYRNNMMIFTKDGPDPLPWQAPIHVNHPDLWLSPRQ